MGRKLGNVLVTGHAGYVGSALLPLLLQYSAPVEVCDTNWFAKEPLSGGRDFRDLTEADLANVDTVFHLAGLSNDAVAKQFPMTDEVAAVGRFAASARAAGVRRFVFSSSAAVYNNGDTPCKETDPVAPVSLYAKAKFEMEQTLREHATTDFTVSVVRLASCFGWAPMLRPDLLVNRMTARAIDGGQVQLSSNGDSARPFVHVEDAAAALLLAAEIEVDAFDIHNVVGDGCNLSVANALDAIVTALRESGVEVTVADADPTVDPRTYMIDGAKFAARGFAPCWSIADGVADLTTRLRVFDTDAGIERSARLSTLYASGQLGDDLRRTTPCDAPQCDLQTNDLRAPLVTPAGVGTTTLDRVVGMQREVMSQSRYRLTGAYSTKVEQLLGDELGLPDGWDVLAMRSGTDSLTRALWLAGVGAGESVVVPDLAFHAVAATVMATGATPLITDITTDTWNLDPSLVEQQLAQHQVAAVIAVDNFGTPADWAGLGAVCRAAGVPLIVDACESLGASRPDSSVGDHADYVAMSFSFTKPIHAAGMGGALCAPAGEIERVEAVPSQLVRQARLPELNAAYLCEAWPSLHRNVDHLRSIYATYRGILEPRGFRAQEEVGVSTRIHAPFLLPNELADQRDDILAAADKAGVQARPQFPSQSLLLDIGEPPPVSADIDRRVVSLPSGAGLDPALIPEVATRFLDVVDTVANG